MSRALRLLVVPAVLAAAAIAVPAAARSGGHASSTHRKCFTVRVHRHHVRECLVPGPRGSRGPRGPRGFTGPRARRGAKGSRGPRGLAGPRGATGATGPVGPAGPVGPTGPAGPAGTAHAYGVVVPGSPPTVIAAQSSGIGAVSNPSSGIYCLTVAGASSTSTPAIVSAEHSHSSGGVIGLAQLDATASDCAAGQFEVRTYDLSGGAPALDSGVAFAIVVP